MPGIYDRIKPGEDRLAVHYCKAAVYLDGRGIFTPQQILDSLNSKLIEPLDAQSLTDFQQVTANAKAGTAAAKLDYLERFDALNIAVESGFINENVYRTELGIPLPAPTTTPPP